MVFLYPRRLSASPSFLTATPGTFSLPESQCVYTWWVVFSTKAYSCKSMFWPFVKIFLTKTSISAYIPHFSKNFVCFTFLSNQNFCNRPLFKPGALCFAALLNHLKTNIIQDWNDFTINRFQTMPNYFVIFI